MAWNGDDGDDEAMTMDPEVMVRQADALPGDLRELTGQFDRQVRDALTPADCRAARTVYVTGAGDSYHAARAVELAFDTIADVACVPLSVQRFVDYKAAWLRQDTPGQALVLAVSASGRTERTVQAVERARARGALTVALTGTPGSPIAQVAHRTILVPLPDPEPSPGIRAWQASLLGLLLAAIRLGEARGTQPPEAADGLRAELAGLADAVQATSDAVNDHCRDLAAAIAGAPAMMVLGSGPSYGTALFAAAKLVEGAGLFAVAQDLEEWAHVERWADPAEMPVFVLAPPGRSHWRAAEVAATASGLGRKVVVVTREGDTELTRQASVALPVRGEVREEFSPLVYHLFASHLACQVARRLGRQPFQAGPP